MPFRERDVAVDPAAAQEVVRRSGQRGVPVIIAGDEVIVGFDRPRLERLVQRLRGATPEPPRPRLGLAVKDAPGGGAEVGAVRPDSPAARAGLQAGDVVEALGGQAVRSAADLEALVGQLRAGDPVEVLVRRGGERLRLSLRTG